jgi:hypothetical protein
MTALLAAILAPLAVSAIPLIQLVFAYNGRRAAR